MKKTFLLKTLSVMLIIALLLTMTSTVDNTVFAEEENGFLYEIVGDGTGVKITGYSGYDTNLHIPSTLGGYPVTGIGYKAIAFESNQYDNVNIPASVTDIEPGAFAGCYIGWITIDSGNVSYKCIDLVIYDITGHELVAFIGSAQSIYEFKISDAVTSVDDYAFAGCYLRTVSIPASVIDIGEAAFSELGYLESIDVDEANDMFCDIDGMLFNKSATELLCYPASKKDAIYKIPSGVTRIARGAFASCGYLTNVSIPSSVVDWAEAFSSCFSLQVAILSEGIIEIPEKAFNICGNLNTIVVPESVIKISKEAFSNCYSLQDIYFKGNAPPQVAQDAFILGLGHPIIHYRQASTGWTTPPWYAMPRDVYDTGETYSVTYDTNGATSGDAPVDSGIYELLDIATIPGNPGGMEREGYTFYGWNTKADGSGICYPAGSELIFLTSSDIILYADWYGGFALGECLEWTDEDGLVWSYQELGNNFCLIYGCRDGESQYLFTRSSLIIPTYIQGRRVYRVSMQGIGSALESLTIPEGVLYIDAFSGCIGLKSVSLPDGLVGIGESAFQNCIKLTDPSIPASVLSIGKQAFAGCMGITGFNIDAANPNYTTSDGVLFDKSMTTLIQCPARKTGDYIIPDSVKNLADGAFSNCKLLEIISIPSSVTEIGSSVFQGAESLTGINVTADNLNYASDGGVLFDKSLTTLIACPGGKSGTYEVPSGTVEIGLNAFSNCFGLTGVSFPASLTRIRENGFSGSGLISIDIPESVTGIGYAAFADCIGLASVDLPDNLSSIEDKTFSNCLGLTSIVIPERVTYIGENAFEGCRSLTELLIPDAVTTLETGAFNRCKNLASVTFGNGLQVIWYGAFSGCNSLTEINLPDSLVAIRGSAFSGCESLVRVSFGSGLDSIGAYSFNNCGKLASVSFAYGVTQISDNTFSGCSQLTSVTLPDSVVRIGQSAFADCTALTTMELPLELESIGDLAFQGCTGLTDVTFPQGLQEIGARAFFQCTGLKSVSLPPDIDRLEVMTFMGCTSLESVILPEHLISVSSYVFYGCSSLTAMTLPTSLISIESGFFHGLTLSSLSVSATNPAYTFHDGALFSLDETQLIYCLSSLTGRFDVPDGVTSIETMAFSGCSGLTNVTLPISVNKIDNTAFFGSTELTQIDVDPDNAYYTSRDGVLFDGEMTKLIQCPEGMADTLVIPEGITDVLVTALYRASRLTGIVIPASVSNLPFDAFPSTTSALTHIDVNDENPTFSSLDGVLFNHDGSKLIRYPSNLVGTYAIPEGVVSVGDNAFSGSTGLTGVILPDSLLTLGQASFQNCTGLTIVTLPESLDRINGSAFYGCTGLTQVILGSHVSLDGFTFAGCTALTDVTLMPGRTSIGRGVFQGCTSLEEIFLPEGLTSLGQQTFMDCTSLKGILIPDSIYTIDYGAFENCTGLKSVIVPDKVLSIEQSAFQGCTGLLGVQIGQFVERIANSSFADCTNLEIVMIPESVTYLDPDAFRNCPSLTAMVFTGNAPGISDDSAAANSNLSFATSGIANHTTTLSALESTVYVSMKPRLASPGIVNLDATIASSEPTVSDLSTGTSNDPLVYHQKWTLGWTSVWNGMQTEEFDPSEQHAITYDANGATAGSAPIDSARYAFDNKAIVLGNSGNLSQVGLIFAGWNTKRDGTGIDYLEGSKLVMGIEDKILYATWTLATQTVHFDSQQGSNFDSITCTFGTTITAPTNPTRTGYTFDGWFKEASCTNAWNFASDVVTTDTTLYAKWTANNYTVIFNSQGGSEISNIDAAYNSKISAPTEPLKNGYTFAGWFKVANCTNAWDFSTDVVTADTTLYAKWTINVPVFVIGDITGDNKVDALDLLKLKKHLLGQIVISGDHALAADITGDGKINALDLLKLKKYLLGQIVIR